MAADRLSVEALRLPCLLGSGCDTMVRQEVEVSFSVCADLAPAGRSDSLADTIDMGRLVASVRTYAERAAHELIEALALEIARVLLTDFPADSATVTVRQRGAIQDAEARSVTVTREKGHFPRK
jgi:dihydroneopterin aldolase